MRVAGDGRLPKALPCRLHSCLPPQPLRRTTGPRIHPVAPASTEQIATTSRSAEYGTVLVRAVTARPTTASALVVGATWLAEGVNTLVCKTSAASRTKSLSRIGLVPVVPVIRRFGADTARTPRYLVSAVGQPSVSDPVATDRLATRVKLAFSVLTILRQASAGKILIAPIRRRPQDRNLRTMANCLRLRTLRKTPVIAICAPVPPATLVPRLPAGAQIESRVKRSLD